MQQTKLPTLQSLTEIDQILEKANELGNLAKLETLATVDDHRGRQFPILKLTMGNPDPQAPVLGFIGGVHGLERIGAQVCIAYLNSFSKMMIWDENTQHALKNIRLFFIPTVNPAGIFHRTRSNANGVDLMRNSPTEGEQPSWMVGGHRISPKLPWYRGAVPGELEIESKALIDAVTKEVQHSSCAVTVDVHSGFGMQDQIWLPYAKTKNPFPHLAQAHSLFDLFDQTYPYHFYRIDPQATNYTTHGDIWDHIYDSLRTVRPDLTYLPLALEMGSWMWVKKNPLQLFTPTGPFNPIKKHRERRILRRHNTLFEFLIKAMCSYPTWESLNEEQKNKHLLRAKERWYE
jgi:hypothetical protein